MKIFEKTGKMALGSRLRLFAARLTEEAGAVYKMYDEDFSPKWFPAFFALSEEGPQTITEIAAYIGHSQPSATKLIKEMTAAGLCANLDSNDRRLNRVGLTEKGSAFARKFRDQYADIAGAVESLTNEATHNLWEAIEEWDYLLTQKSLLKRVQEQKKQRESRNIEIVPYQDQYQEVFKALNVEWISTYFKLEATDFKALDHPKEYILDKGGAIFVALYKGKPLGVCALVKMHDDEYDFELAKMAVSPRAQGNNLGFLLGSAIIKKAKQLGAKKLYLESNTLLTPAIRLYEKLGFKKIAGRPSPYQRVNICMGLELAND